MQRVFLKRVPKLRFLQPARPSSTGPARDPVPTSPSMTSGAQASRDNPGQQQSGLAQGSQGRQPPVKKTMAQLDAELREKLEALSGDGGGAGVEYEDGKAEGLKRGVKSNMFRVI